VRNSFIRYAYAETFYETLHCFGWCALNFGFHLFSGLFWSFLHSFLSPSSSSDARAKGSKEFNLPRARKNILGGWQGKNAQGKNAQEKDVSAND
jgi:hypothetical protein